MNRSDGASAFPPELPLELSQAERNACLNLLYCVLKCISDVRGSLDRAASTYREALEMAAQSAALRDYFNDSVLKDAEEGAKVDRHGNIAGCDGDLGRGGAFVGFKVLIGRFAQECGLHNAIPALEAKGFEIKEVSNEQEFMKKLEWCDVACFISYTQMGNAQPKEFADACTAARNAGKGFWVFADNNPYFAQANAVLPDWFGFKCEGDTPGGKVLQLKDEDAEFVTTGTFQRHTVTSGIKRLFEGITICHPPFKTADQYEDMEVLAMSTDGWPVILVRDKTSIDDEMGRVILDCAFTKLYCNWDDAGTARYVVNCVVWLLALEHRELQGMSGGVLSSLPSSAKQSGKQKFTAEQRAELNSAVDWVLQFPKCSGFPHAVAIWLRDKKEIGNRLISTALLARLIQKEQTRSYSRAAARLLLKLPTDLTEVITEYDTICCEEVRNTTISVDECTAQFLRARQNLCHLDLRVNDASILESVRAIHNSLQDNSLDIEPSAINNLHITMNQLVVKTAEQLNQILAVIRSFQADTLPELIAKGSSVQLHGISHLDNRVLYAMCSGTTLHDIYVALNSALSAAGFEPTHAGHSFTPHMIIGRGRRGRELPPQLFDVLKGIGADSRVLGTQSLSGLVTGGLVFCVKPVCPEKTPPVLLSLLPPEVQNAVAAENVVAETAPKHPACLKKITRDILDGLTAYQAAKYNATAKISRTKRCLKRAQEQLGALSKPGTTKAHRNQAMNETSRRKLEKRISELNDQMQKLRAGDLKSLIRYAHPSKNSETLMCLLNKRYPDENDFEESHLPGTFNPEKVGMRMKLEVPQTWDRALSAKGNTPATWAALLRDKNEKGFYTMPYMALLRNLRNILLMGLRPEFLRAHVFSRLPNRKQIQGSGQTAVSISHTLSVLEKEFTETRIAELQEQSSAGIRDVLAFRLILKKLCRPIAGFDDKQIGIIGEFLGESLWAKCGLKKLGECFLTMNRVTLRDGMVPVMSKGRGKMGKTGKGKKSDTKPLGEKWLPVALHPVTMELLAEIKEVLGKAIEVAASSAVDAISIDAPGPVILWMDVSNPPLAIAADTQKDGIASPEVTQVSEDLAASWNFAGIPYDKSIMTTFPGQELELDEITTHRNLSFDLRYASEGHLDYGIAAYGSFGKHLWNATNTTNLIKNTKSETCAVHSGQAEASGIKLQSLLVDLGSIDENVFALMLTSMSPDDRRPSNASMALRECHVAWRNTLLGGYNPNDHDCEGNVLLCGDITEPLKLGGVTVYACIFRDPQDPDSWLFRNTMELSLMSESRNATQIQKAGADIFKTLLWQRSLNSTVNANRLGFMRLSQLYQALLLGTKRNGKGSKVVRVFMTGVQKRMRQPESMELQLSGEYTKDLELLEAAKQQFTLKAASTDESLSLVLEKAGCNGAGEGPAAVFRVANNSFTPAEELTKARERVGRPFVFATVDGRGHLFDAFEDLPNLPQTLYLPGQAESCVAILRNAVMQMQRGESNSEPLVRYVDSFFPRVASQATNIGTLGDVLDDIDGKGEP